MRFAFELEPKGSGACSVSREDWTIVRRAARAPRMQGGVKFRLALLNEPSGALRHFAKKAAQARWCREVLENGQVVVERGKIEVGGLSVAYGEMTLHGLDLDIRFEREGWVRQRNVASAADVVRASDMHVDIGPFGRGHLAISDRALLETPRLLALWSEVAVYLLKSDHVTTPKRQVLA